MIDPRLNLQRAELELTIARARLLMQISGEDRTAPLSTVLEFAGQLGVHVSADSPAAFRAAMAQDLENAQAELARIKELRPLLLPPTDVLPGAKYESEL